MVEGDWQQRQSVALVAAVGADLRHAREQSSGLSLFTSAAPSGDGPGGLLGGVASRVEVRAAMAWSAVPGIAAEIILLFAILSGITGTASDARRDATVDPAFYKVMRR